MNTASIVKVAVFVFVVMLALVTFQAGWVSQFELPYVLRSLLAISGGAVVGYAASVLLIMWMEAGDSQR